MRRRLHVLGNELAHHLPYTLVSSFIAMVAVWYFGQMQLRAGTPTGWHEELEWSFHVLHPLHVCISAITTTPVIWRFTRKLPKALLFGLFGSVIPCGFSDYVVPFIGGKILGQPMKLHICIIEHPMIILPYLLVGLLCGILFEERVSCGTVFSHGAHVFVSSCAALVYLAAFGFTGWMQDIQLVFPVLLVVVFAVWIPCCIGDIVIPVSALHHQHLHGHHRPISRPSVHA